ncbi:hypothetical protein TNIN_342731 [Trichonephila inaurata madagascariensis]|uniref:Uncharacterized protein n=1 Tax=Trichonephila inaurata madagascariensis TaxID=2747483 RepID=A0A8X6XDF4_9ARAC|nr:hypothetical protein TNIN_461731 [Trichonephila inaurata madagascariensis]GFY50667.1 hypothetical protein TNIN_342731 [Trichonephila inaurata madagascariensis]
MIDWVSIVRTSRRRFSSYKYIPGRIRKRKKKQAAAAEAAKVEPPPKPPTQGCACCALTRWALPPICFVSFVTVIPDDRAFKLPKSFLDFCCLSPNRSFPMESKHTAEFRFMFFYLQKTSEVELKRDADAI